MSKKIKNMLSILFVAVLTVSAFCIPASAAEDDLTISISTDEKDSVTAKAGDTVKYAIYMTDTKEEVIGAAMSFFYNDEYLKLNADSINCESFKTAIGNPKLKNFYTFTWTDVQNPVKLNGDKALVSAEFKVLKGGKTDLSYFISDMYGDDMTYLKSYKITCKLWVNGKEVEDSAVPIVNNDTANSEKIQGDFVNYIDGMGEENSPNKGDHKSVVVEKKYKDPNYSAKDLAKELKTNTRYLSAVVNSRFGMNYSCLLNEYRIKDALHLLVDKRYMDKNVEEISAMVGFANRQSFYAAFYKNVGETPNGYRKRNQEKK